MKLRFTSRDLRWLRASPGVIWGWALDHVRHESTERKNVTPRKHIELAWGTCSDLISRQPKHLTNASQPNHWEGLTHERIAPLPCQQRASASLPCRGAYSSAASWLVVHEHLATVVLGN